MDLKDMEYFIVIADSGSISAAARKLHIAQPPLSVRMKNLEESLGTQLFQRNSRNISLTEAGSLFYRRASSILSLTRSAASEVNSIGRTKTLRIGITPTTMPVMIPYLAKLSAREDLRFDIHDSNTYTLLEQMNNGIIDCALIRSPAVLTGCEQIPVLREPMLAAQRDPLPEKISLPELSEKKLILYRRYEELILKAFRDKALEPDIFCLCDDARTALELAKQTNGCAVFPASMKDVCENISLSRIDDDSLVTDIILVYPRNTHSPSVGLLLNQLREDKSISEAV